jgi:hypothetical protein
LTIKRKAAKLKTMNELQKTYLDLINQTVDYLRDAPAPPVKKEIQPATKKQSSPSSTTTMKVEVKKHEDAKVKIEEKQEKKTLKNTKPAATVQAPKLEKAAVDEPSKPKTAAPITLTTLTEPLTLSSSDSFLSFMQRNFPHNRLHKKPHEDRHAKQVRFGWRVRQQMTSVPIIYDESLAGYRTLLENIAKAISLLFTSSSILNVQSLPAASPWQMLEQSSDIKLIIAPDTLLSKYPPENLTENIAGSSKIGPHELLELPDLSLYQKDPLLKRSLWDLLCQKLQKP